MSKIALTPNASGSGTFTIASPNSDTDRSLTLPDGAGTLDRLERTGNILQVVENTASTTVSTSSTSYVSTGLSASITPTSTSSKILIVGTATLRMPTGGNNYQHTIYRGATNLAPTATRGFIQVRDAGGSASDGTFPILYLDSPSTTSATTYTWYHKSEGGVACYFANDNSYANITLMEIAG